MLLIPLLFGLVKLRRFRAETLSLRRQLAEDRAEHAEVAARLQRARDAGVEALCEKLRTTEGALERAEQQVARLLFRLERITMQRGVAALVHALKTTPKDSGMLAILEDNGHEHLPLDKLQEVVATATQFIAQLAPPRGFDARSAPLTARATILWPLLAYE